MSTTTTEFPEIHWSRLLSAMEEHGSEGVIGFITTFPPSEQLQLYSFAQRAFNGRNWGTAGRLKNFDDYITVARAGIAEAMRQSEEETDDERKRTLKDFGNMMSYNLSADLAYCWPGDETPREQRHFEAGLKAADDCIRWREELDKPPSKKSMAQWAKGMHEISLGRHQDAVGSFRRAFDYALQEWIENGGAGGVTPDSPFDVVLNAGYLGIAETLAGTPEGKVRYLEACRIFGTQMELREDMKEDAAFGLEQLETVEKRYLNH